MFGIILIIFLATVIGYFYNSFYQWRCKANLINKIPGPKAYPIVGNVLDFLNIKKQDYLKHYEKLFDAYGPIIRIWFSIVPIVSLSKAEYMEPILSSNENITKSKFYKFAKSLFGDGLYLANGAEWKRRRKYSEPAFHYTVLESFVPIMVEHSKAFINRLECKMNGCDFNILPFVNDLTLDMSFHLMVGVDLKLQENRQPELIASIDKIVRLIANRVIRPWLWNDYIYSFTKYYKEGRKCLENIHRISTNIIKKYTIERKANHTMNFNDISDEYGSKETKFMNDILLDTCIKEQSNTSVEDVIADVESFVLAASEPSTMAISTTIFILATHPDIQERVAQELYSIFGDSDRPSSFADLSGMKCLQCVIEESMRLYPPTPIIQRELTEEVIIDGKYILPVGTAVELNIYQLHRDPNVYPNPEQFNPDNFLLENCQKRHPYAYVPFSAGPRNCIAHKYIMQQMKIVLSILLRKFELYSTEIQGILDLTFDGNLKPKNGVHVQLKPRNWNNH